MLSASPSADARPSRAPLVVRRNLLRGLAAAAAVPLVLGVAACGGDDNESGGNDEKVELSIMWWGADKRAELTEQALALYTKAHPNVSFKKTWQGNQGYSDKLSTLAAGGSMPDIVQLDDNMLGQFASRNVTLDLNSYKDSKKLDLSKFPQSLADYGVVDGKQAAVPLGENTQGLIYNKTLLDKFKLPAPTTGMSWDDFLAWAANVNKVAKVPGTQDASAEYKAFWVWLRQNGKDFFNGKELGFTEEDVTKWFQLWMGARDAKATPTPDVIHEGNNSDVTKQLVVTGKAASSWMWANQLTDLKKNTQDELSVIAYPGDTSAQWARAAMYFAVARTSKHHDAAVDVINFLVNSSEVGKIWGTDRGIPANTDVRQAVADAATDPIVKQTFQVENELGAKFGKAPQVPPAGFQAVRAELIKAAENVVFGRTTPQKSAADFMAAAKAAISK